MESLVTVGSQSQDRLVRYMPKLSDERAQQNRGLYSQRHTRYPCISSRQGCMHSIITNGGQGKEIPPCTHKLELLSYNM